MKKNLNHPPSTFTQTASEELDILQRLRDEAIAIGDVHDDIQDEP